MIHQLHIITLTAKNARNVQEEDITMDKPGIAGEIMIKDWRYIEWSQILFDIYDINKVVNTKFN